MSVSEIIELNSQRYVVTKLVESYITPLSPSYRTTGVQLRSDNPNVNRYVHRGFPLGLGWQRMNRETGRGVGGLLDSTCSTAVGPITNGKLHETQTHADPAEHFKRAVPFKGDLWGMFEEDYNAAEYTGVHCRKFGATSDDWTGGGIIEEETNNNDMGIRGLDMVVHKGNIFALVGGTDASELVYGIKSSTDGATFADAALIGFPDDTGTNRYLPSAIARRNNFDDDMGRLLSYGNTLLAAIYRHPSSTDGATLSNVQVLSTTDSGANWASDVTIPSGDGPKAFVDWYTLGAVRSPVLILAEGIYSIDTTNNTFEMIYALDGDPNNGRWATVGNDGALYVGLGNGNILRLAITDTNRLEVMRIGPPGDGLVTARQGHVNYILRTPTKWLLVAYGGHAANKNASIFMIDTSVILTDPETGESYMPWHHMWQDATGNLDIVAMAYSTEDDATERLHFAVEGADASINYHIEEPFANAAQTSTCKFQASSILRLPVDDMGDPETNSTILQGLVDADDLGATATTSTEYITESYGLDGVADTTTTLGNYLSGDKDLSYGSGAGVAGKKIGRRLTFYRNTAGSPTTTKTPKLYETEIQAVNLLLGKKQWTFTVDVEETAKLTPPTLAANTPVQETIRDNLATVVTSTTLVTFTAGRMTQTRVRVPENNPPVSPTEVKDADGTNAGYRTGFVTMTVVEAI